jgi:hypothetical protein
MAGNQGDQGDQGDAGLVGGYGMSLGFADRVDLPFITDPKASEQRTGRAYFGDRNWAPNWFAWCVLGEFCRSGWEASIDLPGPSAITCKPAEEEIQLLRRMTIDERPDALGEIVSQADEFISYFLAAMGGKSTSHPASYRVFHIANLAATLVAMHFKVQFDRPRPHLICPALLPPIEVPGHASYPSGHATQAHLFAACAKAMLPTAPVDLRTPISEVLDALAARIARNREIAGLHYESDSKAGAHLAPQIFAILNDEAKVPKFKTAISRAAAEWS